MTVTFTLPRTFDASEFLTSARLMLRADDARWLVSTILRKIVAKETDFCGCARLDSTILQRIMGTQYRDIVQALERGAIETRPYCPGIKCKGYRLAKRYLGDHCVRVPCVDPLLLRRLEQERERLVAEESQARWKPIHYALDAEQRRLTIDAAADAIIDALPDHARLCQDALVSRLRGREFPFTVSTTGRVFNAITGLKRELRAALRIDGERLGSVDICCAQPALLALEMDLNSPTNGLKGRLTYKHTPGVLPLCPLPLSLTPALPRFASLVLSGAFYECLMGLTGLDRSSVKLAFLRDVLAKRGPYPSRVENAFQREFPGVYRFIRAVNQDDHGE